MSPSILTSLCRLVSRVSQHQIEDHFTGWTEKTTDHQGLCLLLHAERCARANRLCGTEQVIGLFCSVRTCTGEHTTGSWDAESATRSRRNLST